MMKWIKIWLVTLLAILGGLLFSQETQAATTDSNFTVTPLYSENQIKQNGYLDVLAQPGEQQTLSVKVLNLSDKDRTFAVAMYTGYTNNDAHLAYDRAKIPSDNTLTYALRHQTVSPKKQTIKVAAKSSTNVSFTVNVPNKQFNGLLAGGIRVWPLHEQAEVTTTEKQTLLRNKYAFGMPVLIRVKDNSGNAKLKLNTIHPGLKAGRITVFVNTQNTAPWLLPAASMDAKITRKGSSKVIHHTVKSGTSMAPNSNFDFAIDWNKQRLQAGTYHLDFTVKATGGTLGWHFSRDFTISAADAAEYNKQAGFKPNYTWLYITIGVLAMLLFILGGYLLGRRGRKADDKNDQA